jgi:nondiscriminating glutamyl-tRNA synthetase
LTQRIGLVNYLALLGWSSEDGKEIFSPRELIRNFSLERLSRSPAVFDAEKLNWVNRAHLKGLQGEKGLELARPFLRKSGLKLDGIQESWLAAALEAVWAEVDTLSQLADHLRFLFDEGWGLESEAKPQLARRNPEGDPGFAGRTRSGGGVNWRITDRSFPAWPNERGSRTGLYLPAGRPHR